MQPKPSPKIAHNSLQSTLASFGDL